MLETKFPLSATFNSLPDCWSYVGWENWKGLGNLFNLFIFRSSFPLPFFIILFEGLPAFSQRSLVCQKNCWSGRMRFWPSSKDKPSKYRLRMQPLKRKYLHRLLNKCPSLRKSQNIQRSQNWRIWISTIWLRWKSWWQSPNWKRNCKKKILVIARIFSLSG